MTEEIKAIFNEIKNEACYTNDELILTFSEGNSLLNYITNLQKENEHLDKVNCKLRKKINNDVYKSRNEKAVEYIKIYRSYESIDGTDYLKGKNEIGSLSLTQVDYLLNILQGGDEE